MLQQSTSTPARECVCGGGCLCAHSSFVVLCALAHQLSPPPPSYPPPSLSEHQSAEAKESTIKNLEGQLFIAWVVAAALCVLGLAAGLNLQRLCKPRAKAAAAPVAAYAKAASPKAAAKVEVEEEEEEEEEEVVVETEVIIPTKKKGRAASGNPKKNK